MKKQVIEIQVIKATITKLLYSGKTDQAMQLFKKYEGLL